MDYSVYVLRSEKDNDLYVGMTSKDPRIRLGEHNFGCNNYTKSNTPYRLVYYEMHYCRQCSRSREKFLKSGIGQNYIQNC